MWFEQLLVPYQECSVGPAFYNPVYTLLWSCLGSPHPPAVSSLLTTVNQTTVPSCGLKGKSWWKPRSHLLVWGRSSFVGLRTGLAQQRSAVQHRLLWGQLSESPYGPAFSFLGLFPKDGKLVLKYTPMLPAARVTTAERNIPNTHQLMNGWIHKRFSVHATEYYSALTKEGSLGFYNVEESHWAR